MSSFSENLAKLRKENKISQQKLAEKICVTQQCVSEWENDNIEPTLTNLCLLADFFNMSIDELVGRKEY